MKATLFLYGVLFATAVLGFGCSTAITHQPFLYSGLEGDVDSLVVVGSLEQRGHCELLTVLGGSEDLEETISVHIEGYSSVHEWIEIAIREGVSDVERTPWEIWRQTGSSFELPPVGVMAHGRRTGSTDICQEERFPYFVIDGVDGVYDLEEEVGYPDVFTMFAGEAVFDEDDEDVLSWYRAGQSGDTGEEAEEMIIEIEGTYDWDWDCPEWSATEPELGFIELVFTHPEDNPDEQGEVDRLMALEGIEAFTDQDMALSLFEQARENTWDTEFIVRGRFTGDLRVEQRSSYLFLVPVFQVEQREEL
jgi:hypothetical protein